jgi:hypothetical protein
VVAGAPVSRGAAPGNGLRRSWWVHAGARRGFDRAIVVAAEGDDAGAQGGVGGEDAVVAVTVDAGWQDEAGERCEKLERREGKEGAAVRGGPRRVVADLAYAGLAAAQRRGDAGSSTRRDLTSASVYTMRR